jgi:hypothetical protein
MADAKAPRYEPGDVVRVRCEERLSVVVLPTHRECQPPADVPDLGDLCCVPIVLIRTPTEDADGVLRWVEVRDLTRIEEITEAS